MENRETMSWIISGVILVAIVVLGAFLIARHKGPSAAVGFAQQAATATVSEVSSIPTLRAISNIKVATSAPTPTQTSTPVASTVSSTPTGPTVVVAGDSVSVSNQPAGSSVKLSALTVSSPSWVAIRDSRGWILGAGWFYASGQNLVVPLLRNTVSGGSYQAVIYVENGNKQFELHKDALVTDTSGNVGAATFTAQ